MNNSNRISTLIFDVDDTLYDVSTGFTGHRNGEAVQRFMVERFGFPSVHEAKLVRDEYFLKYHATAKALTMAELDGRFPISANSDTEPGGAIVPKFRTEDLSEYWAEHLDFSLLQGPLSSSFLRDLQDCTNVRKIAFSNGPRKYVQRVLLELGLWETIFFPNTLFAVDDVLPHCKPERESFLKVFEKIKSNEKGDDGNEIHLHECVMVEDSMKNIRRAKELGMKTILIAGKGRLYPKKNHQEQEGNCNNVGEGVDATPSEENMELAQRIEASEATKAGDAPNADDPAVDVAIETVDELRTVLPGLWRTPPVFEGPNLN